MNLLFRRPVTHCIVVGTVLIFAAVFFLLYRYFRPVAPNGTITVSYCLFVQNTTNLPIKSARISVSGPVKHTATQNCQQIKASHSYEISRDNLSNQFLTLHWEIFPPLSTKVITVQSEIQIWDAPQRDTAYIAKNFLNPEPFIESDDAQIRMQAAKLKGQTSLKTAENIYDWVSNHIVYKGYVSRNQGAVYALKHGQGDCTEYAFLFVALCRASGIPARPMAGFICPKSMVVDLGGYHNWAEFYVNGRWHIADPQNKSFMASTPYYTAFQNIRPSEGLNGFMIGKTVGNGLKVKIKSQKF